ncbi:hypothetical protein AURDEDRAFT_159428 [Auricularia subglabra TFB-10046 SS5]|nr:hypothetical protein AURDEDRAFT_159428 [Auricularia subglabra TFB-10046 SS5]
MRVAISPQLRSEVTSFIRNVVDRALDERQQAGGSSQRASADVLDDFYASISDAVQTTLRGCARTHNNTQTLNTLPPEILGAIFEHLDRRDRLIASHVCQHWRLTAIGDARLWTDHIVDYVGDRSLQYLRPMLDRTKDVPLIVDITFSEQNRAVTKVTQAHVSEFSELLFDHLHHIRELAIQISVEQALPDVLAALQNPAPLLKSFHMSSARSCSGIRLPADLFAGHAPLLERAVLQRIHLPQYELSAFSGLRDLAITAHEKFSMSDLRRLLQSASQLRRLAVVLCDLPRDMPDSKAAIQTCLETLYVEGGIVHGDDELIRFLNLFVDIDSPTEIGICSPTPRELGWILARSSPCQSLSIVSRTGYSFSLRGVSAERLGATYRAWRLHLHHFSYVLDEPKLFHHLRDLTLAEAVWSESLGSERIQLPEAPRLEHFTLLLATEREYFADGLSWGGNFGGVFHLDIGHDDHGDLLVPPWQCPMLRTLRLMSSAENGAMISKRDVMLLLQHHLHAPSLKQLELLRVSLYPPETSLYQSVEVVHLPDDEFARVWPTLFPDLEWAGAIVFGSPTPAASVTVARARGAIQFNERLIARYANGTHTRRAAQAWMTKNPQLKAQIDAAVSKTASKPHFFWSGRTLPATSDDDSVLPRAIQTAKARGGTTLELTVESVPMPDFDGADPDVDEIWQYASDEYANASRGDVYFIKGESLRSGNVWEVYEYPRLKKSRAVKRIFQIVVHKLSTELPQQIFPDVKGCDGVSLIDRSITCSAGAKLYYGSAKRPVVTAKTTVANDATIKVSAGGNAPGITRECKEILTGDFVSEIFTKSGVCEAAAGKGDNGKVMNDVKKLLESNRNRNYMQKQRLIDVSLKVLGTPIMTHLKGQLLDSLVSIDYYEKTRADTAALTKQIDSMVQSATGKSPGLSAAWASKTSSLKATKAALLAELKKQIAQKAKQAKEAENRKNACGKPPAAPGAGAPGPKPPATPASPKPARRELSTFSPAPPSSLERRVAKAPRSGAKAPATPSCPLPGQKPKKVVPRDKLKPKPAPAKKPKVAKTSPKPKPPANKKTAKRPASRPRRQPGKAAPKKRITPKKQPRKVPRPAKKPKGTARPRRGRR